MSRRIALSLIRTVTKQYPASTTTTDTAATHLKTLPITITTHTELSFKSEGPPQSRGLLGSVVNWWFTKRNPSTGIKPGVYLSC